MACIKQRTYIDGEWEITEKIIFVVGNQINEYGGPTADTGWQYSVDGNTKYRTYVSGEAVNCQETDCCLDEIS